MSARYGRPQDRLIPLVPTWAVETQLADADEYEVRVYDTQRGRRRVAAVELISPANKDRPESRGQFVAKCAALLRQRVSVVIVDLVTVRDFNLYADLLDLTGEQNPAIGDPRRPFMPSPVAGARVGSVAGWRRGASRWRSASRCRCSRSG